MRTVCFALLSAVAMFVLTGCGQQGPEIAKASGVVTLGGAPLANARIMFHPIEGGARMSYGTSDESGNFSMSTFGMNDGALVGKHKVTVSKVDLPEEATQIDVEALKKGGYTGGGMPGYEGMMGIGEKKATEVEQQIPEKYSDKNKSQIEVEVTASGPNEFSLNLE
jgi:hypothetical protein